MILTLLTYPAQYALYCDGCEARAPDFGARSYALSKLPSDWRRVAMVDGGERHFCPKCKREADGE